MGKSLNNKKSKLRLAFLLSQGWENRLHDACVLLRMCIYIFELILTKTKLKDIQNVLSTKQYYTIEMKKPHP